ncbi:MAG: acyltransferase family protein [Myxococcaceae bacterium]
MPKDRLPLYDNARGVLILLVAMGHALEPKLSGDSLARGLYEGIYLFHIPAFAFLSGHLTQPRFDGKTLKSLASGILAPLLIFQTLYVLFDAYVLGKGFDAHYLTRPYWILWFLLSLFFWRLLLPLLVKTRAPFTVAVVLALGAGFVPAIGYVFSLSRTFVFLPCFVAGYLTTREQLVNAKLRPVAIAVGVALLAVVIALSSGAVPSIDTRLLYGSSDYAALGQVGLQGPLIRLTLLTAALVLTRAFFLITPNGSSALTRYGVVSLAPFLLHGFFIRLADSEGVLAKLPVVACVVFGALLAVLLGLPPVVKLTRPLWNPMGRARG